MAVLVAAVRALAMISAGGTVAWLTYRYFGLQVLSKAWINLDTVWAGRLIAFGLVAVAGSL